MADDLVEGFKYIIKNLQTADLAGFTPTQIDQIASQTIQALNTKYSMTPKREGTASAPFANQFVGYALSERTQLINKATKGLNQAMIDAGATALASATGTDAQKAQAVFLAMQAAKPAGS